MENIDLLKKLVSKIQQNVADNGIVNEIVIEDLKKLRSYAIEDQNPKLTKVIRLTYEHLDTYSGFNIPLPADDPIEDEDGNVIENSVVSKNTAEEQKESLEYLLSLMKDARNKMNISDLEEYKQALIAYAENN